jgi:hypothetical protein
MLMPAIAFFGGIATFWLAATTNHSLVVDDYYAEGKAINLQLARARTAATLGLEARVSRAADGSVLVQMKALDLQKLPDALTLRVVHPTQAELDLRLPLVADPATPGRYLGAAGALPAQNTRWTLSLEDGAGTWRLTGTTQGFQDAVELTTRSER